MDFASATALEFGRFRVLPHRRELLAEGRPVELGGRAFDVLMALIEARGAVVSSQALRERVWPDRVVGENSLQARISALRSAAPALARVAPRVMGIIAGTLSVIAHIELISASSIRRRPPRRAQSGSGETAGGMPRATVLDRRSH
jgi:hypothetical protein